MRRFSSKYGNGAFSLIEVVLAIALLGLTIVAVVGLIGTTSRSVSDVRDYTTASRISDTIQQEFRSMSFADLENLAQGSGNVELYGNPTGDRVILSTSPDLNDHEAGIAARDRYFQILVSDVGGDLEYNSSYSGFFAFKVTVRWPYHTATGPGRNDFNKYYEDEETRDRQRTTIYHIAVPRREE